MKNNRITQIISTGVTAVLATLILTGCGPVVDGGTSGNAQSKSASENVDYSTVEPAKEIAFWSSHPATSMDIEKVNIADFEAKTGIKVNLVTAGSNYEEVSQKFQAAQGTGEVGDLVVLSDATSFSAYLAGSITPIDDLLKAADADVAGYQDALFDDYLYEGAHYAVPFARSTPIFY